MTALGILALVVGALGIPDASSGGFPMLVVWSPWLVVGPPGAYCGGLRGYPGAGGGRLVLVWHGIDTRLDHHFLVQLMYEMLRGSL